MMQSCLKKLISHDLRKKKAFQKYFGDINFVGKPKICPLVMQIYITRVAALASSSSTGDAVKSMRTAARLEFG
jgi:hypothetical protein